MSTTDLAYSSATAALQRFTTRDLSPVELVQALIDRHAEVGEKVNAFTYHRFDRALLQAREAEAAYVRGTRRPLEGIPLVIKDETAVEGERTTSGSLIYKDHIDDHTSIVAQRLMAAGAILLARSTAPEFSCAPFTWSRLYGVTRTPWNLEYTCGGSSGGSAAALAAGLTTLANGSDIGGSIRIPAAACGVVGYKPPYGRNPQEAPFSLDWYCHAGPMTRTVEDAALMQNVMSGPHPNDMATISPKLEIPSNLPPIEGMRVALSVDLGYFAVDPEVARNTRAAAYAFRELGAEVEEVGVGWTAECRDAAWAHLGGFFGAWVGTLLPEHADQMTPSPLASARRAERYTLKDMLWSMEVEGRMNAELGRVFEHFDILVCPTLATPWAKADHDVTDPSFTVGGVKVDAYLDWCMTYPFNMMSRCPVMAVPSGFASNGVPTGIQIVARPYDDVTAFRAAAAFERARPWLDMPERRPAL